MTFEQHCDKMKNDDVYSENMEMSAVAIARNLRIIVYRIDRGLLHVTDVNPNNHPGSMETVNSNTIRLFHTQRLKNNYEHFEAIQVQSPPSSLPSSSQAIPTKKTKRGSNLTYETKIVIRALGEQKCRPEDIQKVVKSSRKGEDEIKLNTIKSTLKRAAEPSTSARRPWPSEDVSDIRNYRHENPNASSGDIRKWFNKTHKVPATLPSIENQIRKVKEMDEKEEKEKETKRKEFELQQKKTKEEQERQQNIQKMKIENEIFRDVTKSTDALKKTQQELMDAQKIAFDRKMEIQRISSQNEMERLLELNRVLKRQNETLTKSVNTLNKKLEEQGQEPKNTDANKRTVIIDGENLAHG